VSKFFYGGYAMENQSSFDPPPYCHSNLARIIVNDLVIARLEAKANKTLCMIGNKLDD